MLAVIGDSTIEKLAARQIESVLKSFQKQLPSKYQIQYDGYNTKYTAYVEERKTSSDPARLASEKELQLL